MPKSAEPFIRARVPADLKTRVETILRREGLSQQQALEMFWRAVDERGGFPWEIKSKVPNAETRAATQEDLSGAKHHKPASAALADD